MDPAFIILGLIFICLWLPFALQFRRGKGIRWVNFLDGYEPGKYDEPALLRFLSRFFFSLSACGIFWVLAGLLNAEWLFWIGFAAILVVSLFTLIYMNTGNCFLKAK